MKKKPLLLYYSILKFQRESLALLGEHFDLCERETPAADTGTELAEAVVTFAPLGFQCGKEKIDRMPLLRVIASNTTGEPHIDVVYARSKGISVATLKGESVFLDSITPTAEHTFGLLLALMRHIPSAFEFVKTGRWDRRPFGGSAMLSRLSIGIIGLGRLGSMVAQYARAFRMRPIYYFDPFVESGESSLVRCATLAELVSRSDVVTVHVPHEPETAGMINRDVFQAMKPGAYFINTARGELVDFSALRAVLESGRLAGAALDVFEGEFEPGFAERLPGHPLLAWARVHDNLLLTPHIGGSTIDAWRETELFTIRKIIRTLEAKR